MTQQGKFKKNEIVNYYGLKAIVRAIKYNSFIDENEYMIGYSQNGIRKGQTGVKEYELKEYADINK